jgi:hypothetical protein
MTPYHSTKMTYVFAKKSADASPRDWLCQEAEDRLNDEIGLV